MAAYPSTICHRRTIAPVQSLKIDYAEDGSARGRDLHAEQQYNITLVHELLTTAERDSILSFWTTNKTIVNTYVDPVDSTSYDVRFLNRPAVETRRGDRWTVTVNFYGTET